METPRLHLHKFRTIYPYMKYVTVLLLVDKWIVTEGYITNYVRLNTTHSAPRIYPLKMYNRRKNC